MNFHIGDRVYEEKIGPGTVVCIDGAAPAIGVCFDEAFGGHSLGGRCAPGHGYWVYRGDLTHIDDGSGEEWLPRFQKGDRVIYLGGNLPKGSLGTALADGRVTIPVRFDDLIPYGTDCDGRCEDGHGYYCSVDNLRPVHPIDPSEFLSLLAREEALHDLSTG